MDVGSGYIKAGFGHHKTPSVEIPCVYACVNDQEYFGEDVVSMKFSQISAKARIHPVVEGVIEDWDTMEKLLCHTFEKLQVNPEDHKIFMTQSSWSSNKNKLKRISYMFDSFGVEGLFLSNKSLLPLYSNGRVTGIVAQLGLDSSRTVPSFECFTIGGANKKSPIAGTAITK